MLLQRECDLDEIAEAAISLVELKWNSVSIRGRQRSFRGRVVALVDCSGLSALTVPLSPVVRALVALDANYPELASEVHVVGVWWAVQKVVDKLLATLSPSTRGRVTVRLPCALNHQP